MITEGVVEGAHCTLHGRVEHHGHSDGDKRVVLAEVDGRKNYAKVKQDTGVVEESLEVKCV